MLLMRNAAILLTLSFGLFACAGGGTKTVKTTNNAVETAEIEYSIGPGDNLDVHVWRHADLSRVVPVRPDGKISTPLVEDMAASGKTASQLARDIEVVLAEYTRCINRSRGALRICRSASRENFAPSRQH